MSILMTMIIMGIISKPTLLALFLIIEGIIEVIYAYHNWEYYQKMDKSYSGSWDHYSALVGGIFFLILGLVILCVFNQE